ncbi:MAG TPA: prolipoprotein diacylglyceryl transferase [Acidimicrobiales bacterium]|nr:prolipoprotein diacylglyceryl transferase [Acidimicrobiales bacterium]
MLGALSYHPVVHVHIGPLSVSPHGVGIAVGFLLGARLMLPSAAAKGIPEEDVYPMLTWAAVGAILGARVAYVLNHLSDYSNILDAFRVWQGGISLLGGFFGAILFGIPVMYRRRHSFWRVMDAAAPGMALGVVIGRIGDLIVADHLGKTTSFFLGYRCPPLTVRTASPCGRLVHGIVVQTPGLVVHQTALYDLVLTLLLLLVLLRVRRSPRYDGFLVLVFGAWYSVDRIIEDFLRDDVRHFGLTGSQITAIVTLAACLYVLVLRRRTPFWGRWGQAWPAPEAAASRPAGQGEPAREPAPDRAPAEAEAVLSAPASSSSGAAGSPGSAPDPELPWPRPPDAGGVSRQAGQTGQDGEGGEAEPTMGSPDHDRGHDRGEE